MSEFRLSPAIPQLPTGSIDKTADFFSKYLGFEVVSKMPEHKFLIVRRGDAEIHFWQTSEEGAKKLGSESSCYIRVEGVEALFAQLKEAQTPFRYELTKQPWGMIEFQVDDPYGNAIKFGEPI